MKRARNFVYTLVLVGIFSFCGCVNSSIQEEASDLFSKGNHAYRNGEYKAAIGFYEDILKEKISSHELYYNLGNAYYKDSRLGMAVLNYERALRLNPRDADLVANVKFVRSRVPNWTEEKMRGWAGWIFPHLDRLTIDEIALLCLSLLIIGCLELFWGIVKRWSASKWFLFGLIAVALLTYHVTALVLKYQQHISQAVIITNTEAKFEPDTKATTHYTLWEGWKVKVLKESADWLKVERPDGIQGWVPKTALEKISVLNR